MARGGNRSLGWVLMLAGVGCQGVIGDPGFGPSGSGPGIGGPSGSSGPSGPGGPGSVPDAGNPTDPPNPPGPVDHSFACDPTALPSATPLRRLSILQYKNTLVDLFHGAGLDPLTVAQAALASLPPDDAGSTFRGMDARLSDRHVQSFYDVADQLAAAASTGDAILTALAGRCALDATPTAACVDTFLDDFAMRAYRRPLDPTERAAYQALNDGTRDGRELFRGLIFSLLMAPEMLYHLEIDGSAIGGSETNLALGPFELASRLSYHFWQSMPDAELLAAAADGSILDPPTYAAELERVFLDPRTQTNLDDFYAEWFRLGTITSFRKTGAFDAFAAGSGAADPNGNAYLAAADQEIADLVGHFTWEAGGTFKDLLTTDLSFTRSPQLAETYGVPAWDGTSAQTHLDANQRAGLLTRVSFLISGTDGTSPIHRGSVVRRRLLCDELVQPDPSTLPPGSLVPPPPDANMTTRTRFENKVVNQPCATCHAQMNPIGYVLERYDSIGRYRTEERIFDETSGMQVNTLPVDSSAVPQIEFGDQTRVDTGLALSRLVADSGRVEPCFARQYFRFTYHRPETVQQDGCALETVRSALMQGNLRDALKAIAQSPNFKTRRVE